MGRSSQVIAPNEGVVAHRERAAGARAEKPNMGSTGPDKHVPGRTRRSDILQIICQHLADIVAQRQFIQPRTLATDENYPGGPIDVLQCQFGNLTASKSQTRQEQQNHVVSFANFRPPITAVKNFCDLIIPEESRQIGHLRQRHTGNHRSEVHSGLPRLKQEGVVVPRGDPCKTFDSGHHIPLHFGNRGQFAAEGAKGHDNREAA
jgi:hypothetical protein